MIIQNEPKKIAVTEAQMSALRNAYKPQMVQANEVVGTPETNENIINNIVNTPAPEVVNAPGADTLVKDAPKEEQAPVQEEPKVEEATQPVTPVVPTEPIIEAPKAEQPTVAIDNDKFQKLLDDFYDLQLHVQQFGVELEEILEIIKKNEIKQDVAKEEVTQTIAQSTPVTPNVEAPKVEQPVVQEPAPQVQSTPVEQSVFNTSFNPNSEFTGNIFDMPPQTNTESVMKL